MMDILRSLSHIHKLGMLGTTILSLSAMYLLVHGSDS